MKCECETCSGSGQVDCPDCGGHGVEEGDIATIKLEPTVKNYDELKALQKDARRVICQANRLKELTPSRSDSYDAQLRATLDVINVQAEKAAK